MERAQKKMIVLFRLKIVKPLPPKKHFYRSFGLMQGAGRRGKSKPFSVLVLDRILLFFIFAGKTVELSDTEVQLQFSGLTVEDNYVQALTRFSISRKSREEMIHFFISIWRIEFSFLEMLSNVKILQTDSLSLLDSSLNAMSFPILVRNHILLFGLILTISVLQKGKVFKKTVLCC